MKNTLYIESVVGPVNFYYYESDQSFFKIENLLNKNTEQMLTELRLKSIRPDQIVLNLGPGSFTAIRTTVAIAKALFFKTNKKIYACHTFEFINYLLNFNDETAMIIDGFQEEFLISFGGSRSAEIHQVKSIEASHFILSQVKVRALVYQKMKIRNKIESWKLDLPCIEIKEDPSSAEKLYGFFNEYQKLFKTFDWISISPLYFKKSAAEEKLK